MEIQADSISAILLIMKLRYIGVAFIDTFFLLFCMRYTHKKIPKHLVGVMLVVDILVMISAWTSQYHSLLPGHLLCDRRQSDLSAQSLRTGHLF